MKPFKMSLGDYGKSKMAANEVLLLNWSLLPLSLSAMYTVLKPRHVLEVRFAIILITKRNKLKCHLAVCPV